VRVSWECKKEKVKSITTLLLDFSFKGQLDNLLVAVRRRLGVLVDS
jgi:hypothetical protein